MKYLVCLPYAYQPYFDLCRSTMKFPEENLLLIDNTKKNIGIMAAHNLGAKKVLEEEMDWLIILSAAIRFGENGGLDFVKVLEDNMDYYVIHAGTPNHPAVPDNKSGKHQEKEEYRNGVFGWHLTAFKREVFENIGIWDENFTPYGMDDLDLSIRIQKHYKGAPGWGTFPVDVSDTTMAHSLNLAGVKSDYQTKENYFRSKWNRGSSEWNVPSWDHPFNNPANDLKYWPKRGEPFANNNAWEHLRVNT